MLFPRRSVAMSAHFALVLFLLGSVCAESSCVFFPRRSVAMSAHVGHVSCLMSLFLFVFLDLMQQQLSEASAVVPLAYLVFTSRNVHSDALQSLTVCV